MSGKTIIRTDLTQSLAQETLSKSFLMHPRAFQSNPLTTFDRINSNEQQS